jgi:alkanesulfonate monooxygenase SsuD/methylene tetrahydromethanopterin reductase-like flavin-dependent oxidoreductase (luciferase family)
MLSALARETTRVRLGHLVMCAAYRNAALTAKMISTLDTISGGRMELGIGAGWKRDEWVAYGYGFPDTSTRLAILRDHLEVITRMMAGGRTDRATFVGEHARVENAYNVPKPIQQPRMPIMVGGNGPNVTWRLAARFADELNLDGMEPAEVRTALQTIQGRCEEIGRDPSSLAVSVHVWRELADATGAARREMIAGYVDLGVKRIQALVPSSVDGDEGLESFAADCRAAGATLA